MREAKTAWLGRYGLTAAEKKSIQFRGSLNIVKDIKSGDVLTRENVRAIRPGFGLSTKYFELVLGKRLSREGMYETLLAWGKF